MQNIDIKKILILFFVLEISFVFAQDIKLSADNNCDAKSSFVKIIPTNKNEVFGLSIKYWHPFHIPCDTANVNGIYLDINPVFSALGVLGTGMAVIMSPFIVISHLTNPDTTHNLNIYDFKKRTSEFYTNGLGLSVMDFTPLNTNGVRLGIIGGFADNVNGINLSGIFTDFNNINGVSISLFANTAYTFRGVFFAGLMNKAYDGKGLSFAVLHNNSEKFVGLQIGLFNHCSDLFGFQIGLWNSNGKRSLPFFNWQF